MFHYAKRLAYSLLIGILCGNIHAAEKNSDTSRPNIIVIMTDDMGFSDVGCYGGEVETPHLNRLAAQGLRFTQFYNTSKCMTTRASLLSGLYSTQSYRNRRLSDNCVTIAETLQPAGYHTIQTGKWHLGSENKKWWPTGRGFDRCFGCPAGGGFYFRPSAFNQPRSVVRGEEVIYSQKIDPPKGWYTTDAYTDEGLAYVREAVEKKKSFFWYLAYNAPHWPLRAKPEDIAKYRGKYKAGWDVLRQQRYQRMVEMGIIHPESKLSPREKSVPAWTSLSEKEKDVQDLRMATYAAMVDCVDQNVGKIVAKLKELDVYDDTLLLFLSDNGADSSGGAMGENRGKGVCGTAESFAFTGACWANVSNAPFRKYKTYSLEGGISSPLIAHWPKGIVADVRGSLVSQPTHLIDIMSTCVDVTDASYPTTFKNRAITPMEGTSLKPAFTGQAFKREAPLYFNYSQGRAVRDGNWKLVSHARNSWQLYDMTSDRTELRDLSAKLTDRVRKMAQQWKELEQRCRVK